MKKIEKGENFNRSNIDVMRQNLGIQATHLMKIIRISCAMKQMMLQQN